MKIDGEDIDDRVASLVTALNDMPDIYTTESCGGHLHPRAFQLPEGTRPGSASTSTFTALRLPRTHSWM